MRLRALSIINTRQRGLRALSAFGLSSVVLLQLKGKVRFVCTFKVPFLYFTI